MPPFFQKPVLSVFFCSCSLIQFPIFVLCSFLFPRPPHPRFNMICFLFYFVASDKREGSGAGGIEAHFRAYDGADDGADERG